MSTSCFEYYSAEIKKIYNNKRKRIRQLSEFFNYFHYNKYYVILILIFRLVNSYDPFTSFLNSFQYNNIKMSDLIAKNIFL